MRINDFIQFFTTADTKDIVFTIIIFIVVFVTIIGNLYVVFNIKKWLQRITNEIRVVSRHLAHIDPKYYSIDEIAERK